MSWRAVHHRHRHAQHAAGAARVGQQAFMYLGRLIERRYRSGVPNAKIYRTQAYVTGRFGADR